MLLWLLGSKLDVIISHIERQWVYNMDSDFDSVLDCLIVMISYFNLSSFTSKDIFPLKVHRVLTSASFNKSV